MELNVDIKCLPPVLGETTWTGMVAECTEDRTTPKETLSCASHTLRENVMELNVVIKRLPPALGEITWTGTENPRPHNVMIYHVTGAVSDSKLSQSLLGIYPKIQVLFPLHLMHICQSFHFLSVLDM